MISVCIATYNGQAYIKKQITSILKQLSAEDEIIISDDKSSDNTIEIITSINDKRIKIYNHSPVKGSSFRKATFNFENAIKKAKGDYIFLSDQDDIWLPNKVEKTMKYLEDYLLITSNFYFYKDNQKLNKRFIDNFSPIRSSLLGNLYHLPFKGCCFAFRKELLQYILPFPRNIIVHDAWIGCVAFRLKSIGYISEPLILHRIHGNNVSYNKNQPFLFKIEYRMKLLLNLIFKKF